MATELNSDRPAQAESHICGACGRDTRDMETNPCPNCPCRWCGCAVDRTDSKHKVYHDDSCKKAFEKFERVEAIRQFRESRNAS